ncbi:Oidioi.mRNA.OKI2018_I69.chr2.g7462.t1.cds [Oikopleura dioica]|uniref:Oidioi.mRNA.OKI2018_I69.chr2.g7462.t1.cds n=1 Tax=Oikopleura dioica TaxID=34765 RepID=A0ABN7TF86_OIKDI|nr:Oidioi.mRNA.OKI2018_I69.chr2.g7462.t1.cds [Oikopleura dioica]
MPVIKAPTNQKRHTNVAVVRLKTHGKRFELACYKNKVQSWRDGTEKDLGEVLQSDRIFTNVGKGEFANSKDLDKAFGTKNEKDIAIKILAKGDLQVSDKEREVANESLFSEIAEKVSEMSINPQTERKYPPTIIQKAMKETIHYSLQTKKNAKVQAIDVIKQLKAKDFPIDRCKSQVKATIPTEFSDVADKIRKLASKILDEKEADDQILLNIMIMPHQLKEIQQIFTKETSGKASVELISLNKQKSSDEQLI